MTIHDLSFEHVGLMNRPDRFVFRRVVPRAARRAARVLTVSERSARDIVGLYGLEPEAVVVTPNGVDPAFHPGTDGPRDFVLSVGAVQPRKNQLAALAAAQAVGLTLVVVGPEKDAETARQLRAGGAALRGYVDTDELASLYREAACLVQASHHEGFGLPVLEAMASGTPVVIAPDPALIEVAGDAAVVASAEGLAEGIRNAIDNSAALVAAGIERARSFTWRATAEQTLDVYQRALDR